MDNNIKESWWKNENKVFMVERVNGFCRLHCQRGSGTGQPNALPWAVLPAGGAGEAEEVTEKERVSPMMN